jgi:hypothetical protein
MNLKNQTIFDGFDESFDRPIPVRPVIAPNKGYYVTGFVDGEGSFFCSARKTPDRPTGWKFSASFTVGNKDISTVNLCQECIGGGVIRQTKEEFYAFEMSDRAALKSLVVPFFQDYPFLTEKKQFEFEIFQRLLVRLDNGIRTSDELEDFLALRRAFDAYRTSRVTNTDEIIRQTFKPQPDL